MEGERGGGLVITTDNSRGGVAPGNRVGGADHAPFTGEHFIKVHQSCVDLIANGRESL